MPTSCLTLSRAIRAIHERKQVFDDALSQALESNDVTQALERKKELEAALHPAFEMVFPCESPELSIITIQESVRHYRNLYESTGVINTKGESVLRLPGEDTDRHYPMPTEAQVVDYLRSQTNHETIKHLLELGLVKLAIVPLSGFGDAGTIVSIIMGQYDRLTVPPLVRAVGTRLREKFNAHELFHVDGTPVGAVNSFLGNNGRSFLFVSDDLANLTYRHGTKPDPNDATKTVSDWKPLDFMLDPANHATPFPGWQHMLVPTDPRVVRSYPAGSELSALNANQLVSDYEAKLKSIPGLTGWTPEMELVTWLERLAVPGPTLVLHDWDNLADGATLLMGTGSRGNQTGDRPYANWDHDGSQLFIGLIGSGNSEHGLSAVPATAI